MLDMPADSPELHQGQHPDCAVCKLHKDFSMPDAIIKAAEQSNLVIFAGAGISTENPNVFYWNFYNEIKDETGLKEDEEASFPKVMSLFEASKGKKELVQRIKKRFDYVEAFPELYRRAVSFHRELSTLPFIREIITTNWDDYFEKECGAIPIVTDQDFAFWDLPQRKVFKIHGSVNNYGSIQATEDEYKKKYKQLRDGAIGANLKLSLATKKLLFFGYSFQDEDFNRIYTALSKGLGSIKPTIYIISPNEKDPEKLRKFNAVGINTDGTFFLKKLKESFVKNKKIVPDENFSHVLEALVKIQFEHAKIGSGSYILRKFPDTLYLSSYQDGIIHAFERIDVKKKDGSYSCPHCVLNLIETYNRGIKEKRKQKLYHDIAYLEGYKIGLMYLLADERLRKVFPMYYLFGYGTILKEKDYLKMRKDAEKIHKSAFKWAVGWIKYHKTSSDDTVFQHLPFA